MVRLKDDCTVMAKIIDLGLAKAVDERGSQTAISASGIFAGTPEFASPQLTFFKPLVYLSGIRDLTRITTRAARA
jgi:hypothetical protein